MSVTVFLKGEVLTRGSVEQVVPQMRKLVEEALRKGRSAKDCHDSAYRFLNAIGGDLPHFVDAVREMYNGNPVGYDHFTYEWPKDIRDHGRRLAFPE